MSNFRKIYREYAQHKGKEAKEFVEIRKGYYGEADTLITKDSRGIEEETTLSHSDLFYWLGKNYNITKK